MIWICLTYQLNLDVDVYIFSFVELLLVPRFFVFFRPGSSVTMSGNLTNIELKLAEQLRVLGQGFTTSFSWENVCPLNIRVPEIWIYT